MRGEPAVAGGLFSCFGRYYLLKNSYKSVTIVINRAKKTIFCEVLI